MEVEAAVVANSCLGLERLLMRATYLLALQNVSERRCLFRVLKIVKGGVLLWEGEVDREPGLN